MKAMFKQAKVDGTRYCGPVSLSAVTGAGTKEISKVIREYYPEVKRVCGVCDLWVSSVLIHYGVKARWSEASCTLKTWSADWQRRGATYMVSTSDHLLVIRDDKVICTQFGGKIADLAKSRYWNSRTRVRGFWLIESGPALPKAAQLSSSSPVKAKRGIWAFLMRKLKGFVSGWEAFKYMQAKTAR